MIHKTQLCFFFQNDGYCKHGDKCRYAHGVEELQVNYNQKTKMCRHHMQGKCHFGNRCEHAHSQEELIDPTQNPFYKTTMCSHFQRGNCHRNDCGYAHGDEELRQKPTRKQIKKYHLMLAFKAEGVQV